MIATEGQIECTEENYKQYLELKDLAEYTISLYLNYYRLFPHDRPTQSSANEFLLRYNGSPARAFLQSYLHFRKLHHDIELPFRTGRRKQRMFKDLTNKEITIMRYALNNMSPKYLLMFDLSLETGMRRTELVNLKPIDFEWEQWAEDMRRPCRLHIIGKGDKERIVIVSANLMLRLRQFIRPQIDAHLMNMQSKIWQMGGRRWWEILKMTSEGILGKRVKPHALRHCGASRLWASGKFDLIDLQNFLGHSSLSTTQIYLHPDKEASLRKFEKFVSDQEHEGTSEPASI